MASIPAAVAIPTANHVGSDRPILGYDSDGLPIRARPIRGASEDLMFLSPMPPPPPLPPPPPRPPAIPASPSPPPAPPSSPPRPSPSLPSPPPPTASPSLRPPPLGTPAAAPDAGSAPEPARDDGGSCRRRPGRHTAEAGTGCAALDGSGGEVVLLRTGEVVLVALAGFVVVGLVVAIAFVLIVYWCGNKSRKGVRVKIRKVEVDHGKVFGASGACVVSV